MGSYGVVLRTWKLFLRDRIRRPLSTACGLPFIPGDLGPVRSRGARHPAEPQTGRKDFGKAADGQDIFAAGQTVKIGRGRSRERQIPVDIILDDQKAVVLRQTEDLAAAIECVLRHVLRESRGPGHERFEVGGGSPRTLREFATWVREVVGGGAAFYVIPDTNRLKVQLDLQTMFDAQATSIPVPNPALGVLPDIAQNVRQLERDAALHTAGV